MTDWTSKPPYAKRALALAGIGLLFVLVAVGLFATVPGEPIWPAAPLATKAPFTPGMLSFEIVPKFTPAALSKVAKGALPGAAPNDTFAWRTLLLS